MVQKIDHPSTENNVKVIGRRKKEQSNSLESTKCSDGPHNPLCGV